MQAKKKAVKRKKLTLYTIADMSIQKYILLSYIHYCMKAQAYTIFRLDDIMSH